MITMDQKSREYIGSFKPKQFSARLEEAIISDPMFVAGGMNGLKMLAEKNVFFQHALQEGNFSDTAQALGEIQDLVVEGAVAEQIGREMCWVVPTNKPIVRFILAKRGTAYKAGQGTVLSSAERYTKTDITINQEPKSKQFWSQSFLEDAEWNVLERQTAEIGYELGEAETTDVVSTFEGVTASSLAGGAAVSINTGADFGWADCVKLWKAVVKENYRPGAMMVNPDEMEGLWNDDKFISQFYFGGLADVARGVLGQSYLGFKILVSTLVTSGKVTMTDVRPQYAGAALCVRRDVTIKPYENPEKEEYGVLGSERYGLGTLRTKAIARGPS